MEFADASGSCRRERLASCWDVRFEDAVAVRSFGWAAGQRHFPGWWWSATTGRHVGHESWLERDQVMMLDFDPQVVAFSSQPFWLSWTRLAKGRRHAPDYFARLADGTGMVIDVRADDRIPERDAEVFGMTADACASVGWCYRRVGTLAPVLAANVRWLAGYRHPRCMDQGRQPGCGRSSPARPRCWLARVPRVTRSACCRCCFICCGPGRWSPTWSRLCWARRL